MCNTGFPSPTSKQVLLIYCDTAMIQERASLPIISLQPAVVGAAKKTSRAVGQATRTLMNIISRRDLENKDDIGIDRVEI